MEAKYKEKNHRRCLVKFSDILRILFDKECLGWDVNNGVSRRAWSGNSNADITIRRAMHSNPDLVVTLPNTVVNDDFIDKLL